MQLIVPVFLGPQSDLAPEACGLNRVLWSRRNVCRYGPRCCRALSCWSFDGWYFGWYDDQCSPLLVEIVCKAGFADRFLASTYRYFAPDTLVTGAVIDLSRHSFRPFHGKPNELFGIGIELVLAAAI